VSTFDPIVRADWLGAPAGLERIAGGSVTTPAGYAAAGVACGLKASGHRDLGVLVATGPTVSWLMDTTSALPSAPVLLNRGHGRSGYRAIVANSGVANAATGEPGLDDARRMAELTAAAFGLAPDEVAVSSTGVIGERLDMDRIPPAIPDACAHAAADGGTAFNEAICTTDAAVKGGAFALTLGGRAVRIGVAAKGAGMIRPTMATMLAYVTTDATVAQEDLRAATERACRDSFNRISVDGQMSPSDTLLVLAAAEGVPLAGADLAAFADALRAVCRWTAIQMVKDGEGADHVVRLTVTGAHDVGEAERVARAVAESPLVKTAIAGRDPNWGRISQAVGQALSGAPRRVLEPEVWLDEVPLGDPAAGAVMERAEYDVTVALGRGDAAYALWASDLTHAYVSLNADYHT
jgi:glutamate N-acetyltransferase / amino-acid N-acetyltransferase